MTEPMPDSFLQMPRGMKELINFALRPLKVPLVLDEEDVLAYRQSYASGLQLTIIVMYVARRRWLLIRQPSVCLAVVDADENMNVSCRYMVEYVNAPSGPNDVQFASEFMSRFAAMTRAVADVLGGGERTDVV